MAELKEYTFTDDQGREVTLRLSEEDAKARGVTKQTAPENKSRTASNKG